MCDTPAGTENIFDWLLSQRGAFKQAPINAFPTLSDWQAAFDEKEARWCEPIDRAIGGGALADRVAYAFVAGYQAALQRLAPDLDPHALAALCVTEAGGAHPKAVQTRLLPRGGGYVLEGQKRFVSCAQEADVLLVAASVGVGEDGRNHLKLVQLPKAAPGVRVRRMPNLPLIPEVSHGVVTFEAAPVAPEQVLAGDGYLDYVKPFRTLEDVHVLAAVMAYLFRIGAMGDWPATALAEIVSLLAGFRALAAAPALAGWAHVALAGLVRQTQRLLDALSPHWQEVPPAIKSAWERDRALLQVAGKARDKRFEVAWNRYI